MAGVKGKHCIVGYGEVAPPPKTMYRSFWGMAAEAASKALKDAGLSKKDIDGVVFLNPVHTPLPVPGPWAAYFCQYAGIVPAWFESVPYGGMPTGAVAVCRAAMGIEAGLASTVLVVAVDNPLSRMSRDETVEGRGERSSDPQYGWPYGFFIPANFAMFAQRHMHEFGSTSEQLAEVAVAARKWAAMNPIAQMQQPLTAEQVLNSRMLASPLHLFDMCIVSDGGCAVVMTTAERARDMKNVPVALLGFGESGIGRFIDGIPSLTDIASIRIASQQAFKTAEIGVGDVDIFNIYDPATIMVILELEELGVCQKGEGGSFVQGGRLAPGGKLPVNTHGGMLSCRHPGMPGGFFQVTEAVKQLRREAGARQVKDCEVVLTLTEGSWIAHNVTIFGRL